jgi:acetyltransferase EpsM
VVADVARRAGVTEIVVWSDSGSDMRRFPPGTVSRPLEELDAGTSVLLAIGDLAARRDLRRRYPRMAPPLVDPSAVIGGGVSIGAGTVVFPGCIVNANASIGADAILNTGCIVEHDCVIRLNSHLSPGVRLAGGVSIGESTHVGTGAIVLPRLEVGDHCIVGAGAVVIDHVPAGETVVGVPARTLRKA